MVALQPEYGLFPLRLAGGVHSNVVTLITDLNRKSSVLRQANILNLEAGDYLNPGDDLLSYLSRKLPVLVGPIAVHFITHAELLRKFLEHDIASAHIDGLIQDR